ncbi:hypothetical protein GCM10020001_094850 [Nonomuraea salmonea]
MATTQVRTGSDTGPHLVTFAPRIATDQLTRVWLHEITHTFQRQEAMSRGPLRRILRRMLPSGVAANSRDECVTAQQNELAYLIERWNTADTVPEQRATAVDIDGLLATLRARGVEVPPAPWEAGPDHERTTLDIPRLGDAPSVAEARQTAERLKESEKTLRRLREQYKASAREARDNARQAEAAARKTTKEKDSGVERRRAAAVEEARAARDQQERHERRAAVYGTALNAAIRARKAHERYARLLEAMSGPPRLSRPDEVTLPMLAQAALREVAASHMGYDAAVGHTRPDPWSLTESMPTGRLAHLDELTEKVNQELRAQKSVKQYKAGELETLIRADWHKVVAGDGLVLVAGHGRKAVEVRLALTVSDLVEVADPGMRASQLTQGNFYQTGQSYTATESGSLGTSAEFDTRKLAQWLPKGSIADVMGGWPASPSAAARAVTGRSPAAAACSSRAARSRTTVRRRRSSTVTPSGRCRCAPGGTPRGATPSRSRPASQATPTPSASGCGTPPSTPTSPAPSRSPPTSAAPECRTRRSSA